MNIKADADPVAEAASRKKWEDWIKDLGVGYIRINVPSATAGTTWEATCWAEANAFASRTGIGVCLFWGTGRFPSSMTETAYLARVGSLVAANPNVDWFELGNEVDSDMSLPPTSPDYYTPAQYADWLKKMSAMIRSKNPNAKIIMASMVGMPEARDWTKPSHYYFKKILEQGCGGNIAGTGLRDPNGNPVDGKPIVDHYSFHFYWNKTYGSYGPTLVTFLTEMKSRIDATPGAARRPLVISELGYGLVSANNFKAEPGADDNKQNRFITQKLIGHYANEVSRIYPIERVDNFILFDYSEGLLKFGLMYLDGSTVVKRAQYYGYKNTVTKLKGSVPFNQRTFGTDGVCYEYMKAGGQKSSVVWRTTANAGAAPTPASLPMSCATVSVQDSAGNVVSPQPVFANGIVTLPYSDYQRWVIGAAAGNTWREGEAGTKSGTFTTTTVSNADSYNGSHLSMTGSSTADYRLNYSLSVPRAGTYTVWVAATPPNITTFSRYKFNLISGPTAPATGWKYSYAQGTTTGSPYSTNRSLNWIKLGDFNLGSTGACSFSIGPIDSKPFAIDAVYIEPKQP